VHQPAGPAEPLVRVRLGDGWQKTEAGRCRCSHRPAPNRLLATVRSSSSEPREHRPPGRL